MPVMRTRLGRDDKLTPERESRIIGAIQQAGVTQEEAARIAGIGERTFYRWKARAREAAEVLPADWRRRTTEELRAFLEDLGYDPSEVRPGKSGRVTHGDLLAAVAEVGGKYRTFFERLERAMLEGELATVSALRELAEGGRFEVRDGERVFVPIERRRTITRKNARGEVLEIEEEVTVAGRSETALRFILERRYNRWNPRKAVDPSAVNPDDPRDFARRVNELRRETRGSVPLSPEEAARAAAAEERGEG